MGITVSHTKTTMQTREPVVVINAIVAVIEAAIPMLIIFGILQWTPEQAAAVMGVVIAVAAACGTVLGRRLVTPVADPRDNEGNQLEPVR